MFLYSDCRSLGCQPSRDPANSVTVRMVAVTVFCRLIRQLARRPARNRAIHRRFRRDCAWLHAGSFARSASEERNSGDDTGTQDDRPVRDGRGGGADCGADRVRRGTARISRPPQGPLQASRPPLQARLQAPLQAPWPQASLPETWSRPPQGTPRQAPLRPPCVSVDPSVRVFAVPAELQRAGLPTPRRSRRTTRRGPATRSSRTVTTAMAGRCCWAARCATTPTAPPTSSAEAATSSGTTRRGTISALQPTAQRSSDHARGAPCNGRPRSGPTPPDGGFRMPPTVVSRPEGHGRPAWSPRGVHGPLWSREAPERRGPAAWPRDRHPAISAFRS